MSVKRQYKSVQWKGKQDTCKKNGSIWKNKNIAINLENFFNFAAKVEGEVATMKDRIVEGAPTEAQPKTAGEGLSVVRCYRFTLIRIFRV